MLDVHESDWWLSFACFRSLVRPRPCFFLLLVSCSRSHCILRMIVCVESNHLHRLGKAPFFLYSDKVASHLPLPFMHCAFSGRLFSLYLLYCLLLLSEATAARASWKSVPLPPLLRRWWLSLSCCPRAVCSIFVVISATKPLARQCGVHSVVKPFLTSLTYLTQPIWIDLAIVWVISTSERVVECGDGAGLVRSYGDLVLFTFLFVVDDFFSSPRPSLNRSCTCLLPQCTCMCLTGVFRKDCLCSTACWFCSVLRK